MILFIKKNILFIILVFCMLIIYSFFLDYRNSKLIEEYYIAPNITTIVIGDSHTQLGINDSLLPNVLNISQSGEAYIFSYSKLKAILQSNTKIKKVILGFSYHNISSYYDEYIYGDPSKSPLSDYFFILPFEQKSMLFKKNWKSILFNYDEILKKGLQNIFARPEKHSFIGSYSNTKPWTPLSLSTVNKRINVQYYQKTKLQQKSVIQEEYLMKIIEYCNLKDIELVLIRTPLSLNYLEKVPSKFKLTYQSIIAQSNATIKDFKDIRFADSLFLQDGEHLTNYGALVMTKYLQGQ